MAASAEHKGKWLRNRDFLTSILPQDRHPEWVLVAAFYTAVHAVEAALATDGFHSDNHYLRHQYLQGNRYEKIREHYHPLYNGAWLARYDCGSIFTADEVRDKFVKCRLLPIERSVCTLLGQSAPTLPDLLPFIAPPKRNPTASP